MAAGALNEEVEVNDENLDSLMKQLAQEELETDVDDEAQPEDDFTRHPEKENEEEERVRQEQREEQKAKSEDEPNKEEPKDEERRTVPLAALHEAREQNRQMREQIQRMEGRFQQVLEKLKPAEKEQKEEEQLPDPKEDPLGYLEGKNRLLEREIQALKQHDQQQDQASQHQSMINRISHDYRTAAAEFSSQKSDFMDAYNYLVGMRQKELEALGAPPDAIQNTIMQEELQLAASAFQNQRNPAEMLYRMAEIRGYKPESHPKGKEPPPTKEEQEEASKTDEEKFEKMAAGMKSSKTLKSTSPPEGTPTLEKLAAIEDDEEFDKAWDKLFGVR